MAIAGIIQKNGIEMEYCKFGRGDKVFVKFFSWIEEL